MNLQKDVLEELGFEPRSFRLRGRHSTAELHPHLLNIWGKYEDYFWAGSHELNPLIEKSVRTAASFFLKGGHSGMS